MMFDRNISAYLISLLVYIALDALWFLITFKNFYAPSLSHLLAKRVDWWAIAVFYLLYALGISYFAVMPHSSSNPVRVFCAGAMLGLIAYGTYNLVNKAVLKDWPCMLSMIDIIWGMLVTGFTSLITVLLLKKLY